MSLRSLALTFLLALTFAACFLGPLFAAKAFASCHSHRCWHRVSVKRHVRAAWRYYHRHPMPYCTWGPESGPGDPWKRSRYRVLNLSGSGAGGKFQIMYRTWLGYGGKPYGNARYAPPLEQERIARRILAGQGLGAWSRC